MKLRFTLIVVSKADQKTERIELTSSRLTIGRADTNDIVLADRTVSRTHAVLEVANGRLWLIDLDSTNGSFVNNRLVDRQMHVDSGDILAIGTGHEIRVYSETFYTETQWNGGKDHPGLQSPHTAETTPFTQAL